VAGGIIAKLSPSWRDFATSLKHKRQEFSVSKLIGTLDVEERREQRTGVEKGLRPLLQTWCKTKIHLHSIMRRRRTNKRTIRTSLSKQLSLRRKTTRKVKVPLFAVRMIIGQVRAQTTNLSKRRKQPTW
jgi:hypothetical protein